MRSLFFGFFLMLCKTLSAEYHTWEFPPSEGQLYMVVYLIPGEIPGKRQTLIISHYYETDPPLSEFFYFWWDVDFEKIRQWMKEGNRFVYLPYIDSIDLLKSFCSTPHQSVQN